MDAFAEKMRIFRDHKVVNWHEHVWFNDKNELDEGLLDGLVRDAEETGTDMLVCSLPILAQTVTPEEFRHCNDTLAQALRKYPNKLRGFAFVNPGYRREMEHEIHRCIEDLGMIGVKLYYQYRIDDPVMRDLIELCIRLDVPILMHASKLNYHPEEQPFVSNGPHFAAAAREYPEAVLVMAHISGGGDWEWSLKAIADYSNIYTDMSGSVCDDGLMEKTVRMLGAQRVLFGTDGSYSACLGKIVGADLTEEEKITILNNPNFERYLSRGKEESK